MVGLSRLDLVQNKRAVCTQENSWQIEHLAHVEIHMERDMNTNTPTVCFFEGFAKSININVNISVNILTKINMQ